ncbi:flagellar hook-length control protein FliK [Pseudobutyrivibrio sp. YE44]|uniref:flagellar hook-length control protein FliK n=1 Tax=Pseudobutyrivibrio sp. YE44 TaxID=1520802 RepID=UPI000884FD44|nr:flagellar hook-length control protein FliK [Pseudobutyrivibrio sp. YE44]SDB11313.1 flagellar hook-length control protein FliK [Pseudobutyrivibrio sp. YE44]
MTSSNVSNLLVQVKQIDVTVAADKAAAANSTGLFEKALKNVADNVPKADSNTDSTVKQVSSEKQDSKDSSLKVSSQKREITTDNSVEDKNNPEEIIEKVDEVIEEVVEVIKEELDVTEEDIKLAMENLGLTFIDLLNPQSLAQVVAEITGETDSISLIMDDQFAGILEKVTDLTNQLFDENLQSFVEIKDLYETAVTQLETENIPFEDIEVPKEKVVEEETPEITVPKEEAASPVTVEVIKKNEPIEKVETPVEKTVVEAKNEPQVVIKQENKESFEQPQDKKENSFDFNREHKTVKETEVRADATVPMTQSEAPQFVPEQKIVYLPTGETVTAEDIANQFIEQARVLTSTESTTMELTLNPEGLGKIFLEVTQKGNEITAKIFTENDAVKTALESQMANLRTEMNQSSTKVTSIEVSVGTHEFERNLEDNQRNDSRREEQSREQSSKRSNRIDLNSLDGLTGMMSEEDILIAQMMQDNGGTLDFMA